METRGETMTETLSDAEIKKLDKLGDKITSGLQCAECSGIPCRTCRLSVVELMREYIRIQAGSHEVHFLKDVSQYTGLDGKTYGPYKAAKKAKVPEEEAIWLIKAGLAEAVI